MANNLRETAGEPMLSDHHMSVVDLQDGGGWDWAASGEPPSDHPAYYLRWCKSFPRMGGTLQYVQADMTVVLSNLLAQLA